MLRTKWLIATITAFAVCALFISCSKKEAETLPADDQAAQQTPQKLSDAEVTRELPPEGTPEHDALKKNYLEQRYAAVQQKKAGAAGTGATTALTPQQQAIAAEVGQQAAAAGHTGAAATGQAGATTAGGPAMQPGVTPGSTRGSVRRAEVKSTFPCKSEVECTFTKFANTPKRKDDCTCQAACTPFVVSKAEKNRREAANKSLCNNSDWFGDQCPAPTCGFIEFDNFKCVDGKCVGWALGE